MNNINPIYQTTGTYCWFCKRKYGECKSKYEPDKLLFKTKDHIIPRSLGGNNHPDNYIGCCYDCNQFKGNRNARQFALYIESLIEYRYFYEEHYMFKFFDKIRISAWKLYNKTSKLHPYQKERIYNFDKIVIFTT